MTKKVDFLQFLACLFHWALWGAYEGSTAWCHFW